MESGKWGAKSLQGLTADLNKKVSLNGMCIDISLQPGRNSKLKWGQYSDVQYMIIKLLYRDIYDMKFLYHDIHTNFTFTL